MGIENINWYPGHMKKTRGLIQENLRMADVVLEVADARIPISSRNPIIDELVGGKSRLILLNKRDLADESESARWVEALRGGKTDVLPLNSMSGDGIKALLKSLAQLQDARNAGSARKRPLRAMIAGVPNVGKSSLINRLAGRKSAKTGDRPGVTRGKQWLSLGNGMQLLDTPGILWPKFEDPKTGLFLAFCGSIKDEIMDMESLALELVKVLAGGYPLLLEKRYGVAVPENGAESGGPDLEGGTASGGPDLGSGALPGGPDLGSGEAPENGAESGSADAALTADEARNVRGLEIMEAIARRRGFIKQGGKVDYERTARTVLDEFRGGLIGKITLEKA
ncbi:MAG: ribosome biogenesis GTPase YlqF [Clostridiales Family XIII bacterium]|jgi:ribosome biogenesis GTPase A|nr:ribosome biogenesis GTPase YlqF [Clostridiales Family XIII bacterium]